MHVVDWDVYIDHDLDNNPLWIKTVSEQGSNRYVFVMFFNSEGDNAGGIYISFSNTLEYYLQYCSSWEESYKAFPPTPPTTKHKVWKITLDKTAGIRIIVHCNGVEVLDVPVSEDECGFSEWRSYWSRRVETLLFPTSNALPLDDSDYLLENPDGKYKYQPV